MLQNILPASLLAAKLEHALASDINDLYFVSHNAKSFLYGMGKAEKGYRFVLSQDGVISDKLMLAAAELEGFQANEGDLNSIYIKHADYDVRIDAMPIDKYLLRSAFAGDGMALHVVSGRLIVLPEYLTMNPIEQIRDIRSPGLPHNKMLEDTKEALDWKLNHRSKLQDFQTAATELAARLK